MVRTKKRPVRDFIGYHLFLRGREVKVTVFLTAPHCLTLVLGGSLAGQGQPLKFVPRSVGQTGRRLPKNQVKAERGAQENTRQYREANVLFA